MRSVCPGGYDSEESSTEESGPEDEEPSDEDESETTEAPPLLKDVDSIAK